MAFEKSIVFDEVKVGQILTCKFNPFDEASYSQVEVMHKFSTWCRAFMVKKVGENCVGLASVSPDNGAHLCCSNSRHYPIPNTYIKNMSDAMRSLGF